MTHQPNPTTEELLEHYRRGFEGASKALELKHRLYKLWRDFATRVDRHPLTPIDVSTDYQRTMVADSDITAEVVGGEAKP